MLLVGSRALLFRAPHLLGRQPRDFDFIGQEAECSDWISEHGLQKVSRREGNKLIVEQEPPCEFELIQEQQSNQMLSEMVENDPATIKTKFGLVPNLNLLFTLKASHKYLKNSPHFWKTARDYHVLKATGAQILPEYLEFFKLREKETYNYKHPNLNVKKNDFFKGDEVTYIYDHDSIHEAMKHGEVPAYKLYQKDGSEVLCDKNKWLALPEEVRIQGVLEESYVLALERSQIPHRDKVTPRQSFMMALSKVCSSITSGWFREYGYEHIFEIVKAYDDKYLERFDQAVESGIVKKL